MGNVRDSGKNSLEYRLQWRWFAERLLRIVKPGRIAAVHCKEIIRFANADGQLWPGEFVDVTLILAVEADALVVPAQAVLTSQQGTYVFIVNGDGSATQQAVTVARTVDSLAVIADGVVPGALVVTDGQLRLTPNAHVDIRGAPRSESAGGSIR